MLHSIYLTFPMAMHCNDLPVLLHCTKVLDRVPFVEVELLPIMPLFFSSSAASAKKVEKDDIYRVIVSTDTKTFANIFH